MRRLPEIMLGGMLAVLAAGCAGNGSLSEKLLHPGPAQYQRQRAEKFDPYNEISVGSRDDTSRPLGYIEPNTEAARGRWNSWGWPRFGHDPPPYEISRPQ